MHIYNVSRIPSRIIKPMEKTKLIDNGHGYVSAAESILEPPKKNKAANDIVARVIGDFGRWQLRLSIMMALLKFPIGWYQLNILFLAPPQEFWCVKPAAFGSFSVKEWREMCAPRIEEHPCLIFDPEILAMAPAMERAYIPLIECPEFEYDTAVFKRTIVSDFDLVCSRHWLVSFTQVINMCGILTGGLLFGVIADKFGRKTPLMFAICLQAFASFGVCYTTCYCQFIAGFSTDALLVFRRIIPYSRKKYRSDRSFNFWSPRFYGGTGTQEYDETGSLVRSCNGEVTVNKCEGMCSSQVHPSIATVTGFSKECHCCRENFLRDRVVTLSHCYDSDGIRIEDPKRSIMEVRLQEPDECQCFKYQVAKFGKWKDLAIVVKSLGRERLQLTYTARKQKGKKIGTGRSLPKLHWNACVVLVVLLILVPLYHKKRLDMPTKDRFTINSGRAFKERQQSLR
ncbi:hypothetical protein MSG28_009781 [Choristoneura fumiferana]|uniref:Uncharacterized protein n=1 Tax=Choristoneura fumiferana TaxID=7141 RepID=A0ACC0JCN1_CHOFU|nr:hypothetical protein MSG28_009781 [Choristoneura fumiferana]